MPLPRRNLGDFERHPETLFVLADALVGAGQRRGAFLNAAFELLIRQLERLLGFFALRDLAMKRRIEVGKRAGLAKDVDEDTDLGPQDHRIDRFAEIVDGPDPISPQDVVFYVPDPWAGQSITCRVRGLLSGQPALEGVPAPVTVELHEKVRCVVFFGNTMDGSAPDG